MRLKNYASLTPAALTTLTVLCSSVNAKDYAADLSISASGKYDDNIRMASSDKTAINGIVVSQALVLSANAETAKVALDSKFDFSRYNDSGFNSNDQLLKISAAKQFERSIIGLDTNIIRNSTIASELLDSGRIGNKAQRSEEYGVNPSWQVTVSENNQLAVDSQYSIHDYQGTGYIGYKNWDNSIDWTYALSERWKIDVVALHSHFRSDWSTVDVPSTDVLFSGFFPFVKGQFGQQRYSQASTSLGGQIGASYTLNESNSVRVLVGRSRNKASYSVEDPSNICGNSFREAFASLCSLEPESTILTTALLGWTWANERQQIAVQVIKSQQPSSSGVTVDAIRLSGNWSYRVTELDRLSVDMEGTRNRALASSIEQNASILDRDYAAATVGYHRQLSENWYIDASYQYRHQDYKNFDATAASNLITIGIRYLPVARHWSR